MKEITPFKTRKYRDWFFDMKNLRSIWICERFFDVGKFVGYGDTEEAAISDAHPKFIPNAPHSARAQ